MRIAYPNGRQASFPRGRSILEVSRAAGIPHASVCGGRGRCSTCRVRVVRDPRSAQVERGEIVVAERTDPEKVCPSCRDRSHCPECYLNRPPLPTGTRLPDLLQNG